MAKNNLTLVNYSVKPDEQSQACLSYAMAKNSLTLVNVKQIQRIIFFPEYRNIHERGFVLCIEPPIKELYKNYQLWPSYDLKETGTN